MICLPKLCTYLHATSSASEFPCSMSLSTLGFVRCLLIWWPLNCIVCPTLTHLSLSLSCLPELPAWIGPHAPYACLAHSAGDVSLYLSFSLSSNREPLPPAPVQSSAQGRHLVNNCGMKDWWDTFLKLVSFCTGGVYELRQLAYHRYNTHIMVVKGQRLPFVRVGFECSCFCVKNVIRPR